MTELQSLQHDLHIKLQERTEEFEKNGVDEKDYPFTYANAGKKYSRSSYKKTIRFVKNEIVGKDISFQAALVDSKNELFQHIKKSYFFMLEHNRQCIKNKVSVMSGFIYPDLLCHRGSNNAFKEHVKDGYYNIGIANSQKYGHLINFFLFTGKDIGNIRVLYDMTHKQNIPGIEIPYGIKLEEGTKRESKFKAYSIMTVDLIDQSDSFPLRYHKFKRNVANKLQKAFDNPYRKTI